MNTKIEISRKEIILAIKKIRKIMVATREKELSCGFTRVSLKGYSLKIEHVGNMGNSLDNINENMTIMGLPSLSELKRLFKIEKEMGSADYYYKLQVRIRQSKKITIFPNTIN